MNSQIAAKYGDATAAEVLSRTSSHLQRDGGSPFEYGADGRRYSDFPPSADASRRNSFAGVGTITGQGQQQQHQYEGTGGTPLMKSHSRAPSFGTTHSTGWNSQAAGARGGSPAPGGTGAGSGDGGTGAALWDPRRDSFDSTRPPAGRLVSGAGAAQVQGDRRSMVDDRYRDADTAFDGSELERMEVSTGYGSVQGQGQGRGQGQGQVQGQGPSSRHSVGWAR